MEDGPKGFTQEQTDELYTWWKATADDDFDTMMPKADEYSSIDLDIIGFVMERSQGIPADLGLEAACLWYLLGKLARAIGAYTEGGSPSDDTLHDITVYSMMVRRIRETGGWPFPQEA